MPKVLEIKNLKKEYHTLKGEVLALQDISFSIDDKDFVAIVGPSGCGKSTILSILTGLDNDFEGLIDTHNKKIGYMLQTDCLLPYLTIWDNAILGLRLTHSLTKENLSFVDNLIKKYNLLDFKDKYPSSLSGGMRQRVALIRTLATNPDILLLDEPFSALDYQTRLEVSNDVYNIIKSEGKTAIIVTHDIGEAIATSSKVIVLSKRPAIIKSIYDIKLDNPKNPILNRKDAKFNYYYELIWKELEEYVTETNSLSKKN